MTSTAKTDDMRERFEAWWKESIAAQRYMPGTIGHLHAEVDAWHFWQAATFAATERAAKVAEDEIRCTRHNICIDTCRRIAARIRALATKEKADG